MIMCLFGRRAKLGKVYVAVIIFDEDQVFFSVDYGRKSYYVPFFSIHNGNVKCRVDGPIG